MSTDTGSTHDDSWQVPTARPSVALIAMLNSMRQRIELLEAQMDSLLRERAKGEGERSEGAERIARTVIPVAMKAVGPGPWDAGAARSKTYSSKDRHTLDDAVPRHLAVLACEECSVEYPVTSHRAVTDLHNHCVRLHGRAPTVRERTPRRAE